MKLQQLKPVFERFQSDFSTETGKRLSDQHFQLAFNLVKDHEMDSTEIKHLAHDLEEHENWDRTKGSASFVLSRMHVLIHGIAPHGVSEHTAEKMFDPSGPMIQFAASKGIDAGEQIKRARIELKGRKPKITQADAARALSDYYMKNRQSIPREVILPHKNDIIADIMTGLQPQEAINRYLQ